MGGSEEASIQENLGKALNEEAVFEGLAGGASDSNEAVVTEEDGHAVAQGGEGLFGQFL